MADEQDATRHFVCRPACGECGKPASLVELVPPGDLPGASDAWTNDQIERYREFHDPTKWRFIYEGIVAGNGGDDLPAEEARQYREAFSDPLTYERVRGADLHDDAGFCAACDKPYCYEHWNVSDIGYGHCPAGHGKSLDPHWSPDH